MDGQASGFTLNDYLSMTNSNRTILFLVPDRKLEMELESSLRADSQRITVWEIWTSVNSTVLRPQQLWNNVIETDVGARRFLVGISEYLNLVDSELRKKMWQHIFSIVDGQTLNIDIVMYESDYEERYFDREKYEGSLQIVRLRSHKSDESPDSELYFRVPRHIQLVPATYNVDTDFKSIPEMLERLHDVNLSEMVTVSFTSKPCNIKGLNPRFITYTEKDYIQSKLNIIVNDYDAQRLIEDLDSSDMDPHSYLKERVPNRGDSDEIVFHKLWEITDTKLLTVFRQMALKVVSKDSYIHEVLSCMENEDAFKDVYVVQAALKNLGNPNSKRWALERQRCLSGIDETNRISEFVSYVKGIPDATPWLNCGTESEHCELIRRAAESDLEYGISTEISRLYPELGMYLSESESIPVEYRDYFRQYRILKVKNDVTPEFIEMVDSIRVDKAVLSRATILANYNLDGNLLQVVDGLSCEYIPYIEMVLAEAGYKVEKTLVAKANLPTTTEFNRIEWTTDSELPEIKCVDNIAHGGKTLHEYNSPEKNLEAVLSQLRRELLRVISDNIDSGKRIIFTSDHGTSRLVTLADKRGLSKTIQFENPDSWRYVKDNGGIQPDGVETSTVNRVNYWVAKGYNHFNKKGGNRTNEHHGGGSIEERLVPVIVVNGRTNPIKYVPTEPTIPSDVKDSNQIVENDIFKDL